MWLCNVLFNTVAERIGYPKTNGGGWLQGLADDIILKSDVKLAVVFPQIKNIGILQGITDNISYYGFYEPKKAKDELALKSRFLEIMDDFKPDIIHIFGTEFIHSLLLVEVAREKKLLDRVVVSIQGMPSVYAKHANAGIPLSIIYGFSLRDFVKRDNLYLNTKDLIKRGEYEEKTIKNAKNVIGRTDWDKACVTRINPSVSYYFCNETLRHDFYNHKWDIGECEKHSIFVSQCHKPIKGFHFVLEAAKDLLYKYPDLKIYTTGRDLLSIGVKEYHTLTRYQQYIIKIINRYNLRENVIFCGFLSEKEMCNRYLRSNVFVSASSIENSPNSVGEAMLLGVPTISSDVGGVKNMLLHGEEGYIYPFDEPYMLSYYIDQVFSNDKLAKRFSSNAQIHAGITHNGQKNANELVAIYHSIMSNLFERRESSIADEI